MTPGPLELCVAAAQLQRDVGRAALSHSYQAARWNANSVGGSVNNFKTNPLTGILLSCNQPRCSFPILLTKTNSILT